MTNDIVSIMTVDGTIDAPASELAAIESGVAWWHTVAFHALASGRCRLIRCRDGGTKLWRFWVTGATGRLCSSVVLHWIVSADDDEDMHSHPCDFSSTVLSGAIAEQTARYDEDMCVRATHAHDVGATYSRCAPTYHRIDAVSPETWTIVRAGPLVRDWDYLTPFGLVDHRTYHGVEDHK